MTVKDEKGYEIAEKYLRKKYGDDYVDFIETEGQSYLDGLAEGRKEKELSYKVEKVTKAELNKCKTIEEKMEWLGKVLGQAIFENDMNYAVWVNVQKNNIIESIEKENEQLKKQEEILLDRILTLQKTNGSLTDKINALEEHIKEVENDSNNCEHWSYEKIEQLNAQIEKMKNCGNCNGIINGIRQEKCHFCIRSKLLSEWEFAE